MKEKNIEKRLNISARSSDRMIIILLLCVIFILLNFDQQEEETTQAFIIKREDHSSSLPSSSSSSNILQAKENKNNDLTLQPPPPTMKPTTSFQSNNKQKTLLINSNHFNSSSINEEWIRFFSKSRNYWIMMQNVAISQLKRGLLDAHQQTPANFSQNQQPFREIEQIVAKQPKLDDNKQQQAMIWQSSQAVRGQNERKTTINPIIFPSNTCIYYGFGISIDSHFEKLISQHCHTFAFDCTISPSSPWVQNTTDFTFFPTCIISQQEQQQEENNNNNNNGGGRITTLHYNHHEARKKRFEQRRRRQEARGIRRQNIAQNNYNFYSRNYKSLSEIVYNLLHHDEIHYLKLDIEGGEWSILSELVEAWTRNNTDLLLLPPPPKPYCIMVELHTQGANPKAVPVELVQNKTRLQVNTLLLGMMQRAGYALLDFEVNPLDTTCAEFSFVLLPKL